MHLVPKVRLEQLLRTGSAATEQEAKILRHVGGTGPDASRHHQRRHRRYLRMAFLGSQCPPLACQVDRGIGRTVAHSQRLEDPALQPGRIADARNLLKDMTGKVEAQVGVAIARTHRKAQPCLRDAADVRIKARRRRFVVVAQWRLVRESRAIGKQQAQADALLWSMLEAAAHRERRQIAGNGRVQIKDAVLHGQQHRHRREILRGGLDAEHRAGVYGHAALA